MSYRFFAVSYVLCTILLLLHLKTQNDTLTKKLSKKLKKKKLRLNNNKIEKKNKINKQSSKDLELYDTAVSSFSDIHTIQNTLSATDNSSISSTISSVDMSSSIDISSSKDRLDSSSIVSISDDIVNNVSNAHDPVSMDPLFSDPSHFELSFNALSYPDIV